MHRCLFALALALPLRTGWILLQLVVLPSLLTLTFHRASGLHLSAWDSAGDIHLCGRPTRHPLCDGGLLHPRGALSFLLGYACTCPSICIRRLFRILA